MLRVARPSAPPTCCIVLSTAEATPESSCATPATAVSVIGTNTRPMPTAMRTIQGSRFVAYRLFVDVELREAPHRHGRHERTRAGDPAWVDRVIKAEAICAAKTIPNENGRNAKPALSGE